MKKWLLSLCMVLALVACKEEKKQEANAKPVIKIGVIYPMSGDAAALGEAAKSAANMFFDAFNKKEHVFDYKIIFEDNQNVLAKQATLARKLIDVDKVDVLITAMSNFGAVVSPMAEQSKVLHFSVATDSNVAEGKYNLITSSNPNGEAGLLYEQLVKKGGQNVDIIIMNATGPLAMLDSLQKINDKKKGLNIGQIYRVNPDEKDFRLMLAKIKEHKPDYILAFLFMPAIDVFMKQYRESLIDIPVTGIETFTYLQNKPLANGMWYVDAAPATDEFVKKYQQYTGKETTDYAEYMDFCLQMITFGYENVGVKDKLKIAEYIQNNSDGINTAVGIISTEPDGILNGQPKVKKIIDGATIIVEE